MLFDALIIGGGPAGLSAALALGRVCRTALVLDSGVYRNEGVTAMHTVLSRDGSNPVEFRKTAIEQIKHYPSIHFQQANVVEIKQTEVAAEYTGFTARDSENRTWLGRKLILAMGTEDMLPEDIPGYRENWPSHIYQCLFCDGFEQKDHPIGVLTFAHPSYSHLVLMAMNLNPDVTIYSNGQVSSDSAVQQALKIALARGARVDSRKVTKLVNNGPGPEKGITVEFEDGASVRLGMLLHRPATRNRGQHLIDQLELKMKEGTGEIWVDPVFAETSVKGCFAAGDTSDMFKQVALAMGSGLRAGAVASMHLCIEEGDRAIASL